MSINWKSVIFSTLFIVLAIVALVDFLQGGIMWPLLLVAMVLLVVVPFGARR